MSWLWKDKKQQEKTKLEFSAKNRRRDVITRTIRVHLELQMEYPDSMDIIQAIRETKTSFDLPMGIEMKDAHLAHVEILGEPKDV
jgi:hypothetical protein